MNPKNLIYAVFGIVATGLILYLSNWSPKVMIGMIVLWVVVVLIVIPWYYKSNIQDRDKQGLMQTLMADQTTRDAILEQRGINKPQPKDDQPTEDG